MGLFDFLKKKQPLPQSKDAMVIAALLQHKSNITKPHDIDFFFYMPTQEIAENFSTVLKQDGYNTTISSSEAGDLWCIQGKKSFIPSLSTMENLTIQLGKLAASYGGQYDGWGTNIVK